MKIIPYLIVVIVLVSVMANCFLLIHKEYQNKYMSLVNIVTGICLWLNVILMVISKRHLKKRRSDAVHKIFSKN